MFDELIDTPCGTAGGHSSLPMSLLHSRHSGSGSDGFIDAGEALELGAARGPARGSPPGGTAGHMNPAFSRSNKKTLRIREPNSVPYDSTGMISAGLHLTLPDIPATSSRASSALQGR